MTACPVSACLPAESVWQRAGGGCHTRGGKVVSLQRPVTGGTTRLSGAMWLLAELLAERQVGTVICRNESAGSGAVT